MQRFYKTIIFTETPLKHRFRLGDIFQIYPIINDKAPISPYAEHFPVFFEYVIEMEPNLFSELDSDITKFTLLRANLEKELLSLLSVFTNHRFFNYKKNHHWGLMTPNQGFDKMKPEHADLFNNQYCSWVISGYSYPELKNDLTITEFTNIDLPEVQLRPYYDYFKKDPIENKDGEISFPDTIAYCFDEYFKLTIETQERVKAAIYLICDGIDLSDKMRSVAFLCFVSSIETMISLEVNDDGIEFCKSCKSITGSLYHCEKCGKPIWGIRKKFVEYLKKFVAGGISSQKKYKKIYDLRSSIAHSGRLFMSDMELSFDNMDKKNEEWLMKLVTLQLARLNIVNWLRYDKKASH